MFFSKKKKEKKRESTQPHTPDRLTPLSISAEAQPYQTSVLPLSPSVPSLPLCFASCVHPGKSVFVVAPILTFLTQTETKFQILFSVLFFFCLSLIFIRFCFCSGSRVCSFKTGSSFIFLNIRNGRKGRKDG